MLIIIPNFIIKNKYLILKVLFQIMIPKNKKQKNFIILGAAGYVAPRHMNSIYQTNNDLIAVVDPSDSLGVIDNFFPEAKYFLNLNMLKKYLIERKKKKLKIDFITICSPNYLHAKHIDFGLSEDCDLICEKPLVTDPKDIYKIIKIKNKLKKNIFPILQLRLHSEIIKLKKYLKTNNKIHDVELTYITPRGSWYSSSWKGKIKKSGGIAMNIGIHLFDVLIYLFGDIENSIVNYKSDRTLAGKLILKNANVRWFLSTDNNLAYKPYRKFIVNNLEFDMSKNFDKLHTQSYKNILNNKGFVIEDTIKSLELTYKLSKSKVISLKDDYHPYLKKNLI